MGKYAASTTPSEQEHRFALLPIDAVVPSHINPRQSMDEIRLEELTRSIREHGVLQPILVQESDGSYSIVIGERRWRAAGAAGLTEIPARILPDMPDSAALQFALIENLNREDLNPIDEAEAYRVLANTGMTQDDIAAKIGRTQGSISNAMRLLHLPATVRLAVTEGKLTAAHARALVRYADRPELCRDIATCAIKEGWTSKELETGWTRGGALIEGIVARRSGVAEETADRSQHSAHALAPKLQPSPILATPRSPTAMPTSVPASEHEERSAEITVSLLLDRRKRDARAKYDSETNPASKAYWHGRFDAHREDRDLIEQALSRANEHRERNVG